jgi:hypothetical protein
VVTAVLPNSTAGEIERLVFVLFIVCSAIFWSHRRRGVPLLPALLWGAALLVALGILVLPIQTHAVKLDMPAQP